MTRVKICCISSIVEARMAVEFGANALGLVGRMPSGPGVIDDDTIHSIREAVPPGVSTFLLTSEMQPDGIIAHHNRTRTDTIQIVDRLLPEARSELRQRLPGIRLVQVVHVIDESSVEEALIAEQFSSAILLDSGNPALPVKELGGTGRAHDWKLSLKIREQVRVPVFLAGGLNPKNIREAIEIVQPFGVDICSGVRTNGKLDPQKLEEFFSSI